MDWGTKKFSFLVEMINNQDYRDYKNFDPDKDQSVELYQKIKPTPNLKGYNRKQIEILTNHFKETRPNRPQEEIIKLIVAALNNDQYRKALRNHIAFHNPELFDYIDISEG